MRGQYFQYFDCFTPYQRLRLYNGAPFSRLLRHAGDTEILKDMHDSFTFFLKILHSRFVYTVLQRREKERDLLFNITCNDISVIHVTAHRYAGGLK